MSNEDTEWVAEQVALFLYQWVSHDGAWPPPSRDLAIHSTLLRASRPVAAGIVQHFKEKA